MNIQNFKLGNLIRISPRKDEEGVLFLIDIQQTSVIGEMIIPREGYHFRIKFEEMLPLALNAVWLERLGFYKQSESDNIWVDHKNFVEFKFDPSGSGFLEKGHLAVSISSVHELQNSYTTLTGEELAFN